MKRILQVVPAVVALLTLCSTPLRPALAAATYGAGPHGYDWAIGTWSCTNGVPSPVGGPSKQTLVVSRANGGAILYHATGENFDNTWYNIYVPSTKSWVSPFIISNGSYGNESTMGSGTKIVWTGTAYNSSGKMMHIRDTNTIAPTKYSDLGEYESSGGWKTQYSVSCTKG
jgi:hypothetical protein